MLVCSGLKQATFHKFRHATFRFINLKLETYRNLQSMLVSLEDSELSLSESSTGGQIRFHRTGLILSENRFILG